MSGVILQKPVFYENLQRACSSIIPCILHAVSCVKKDDYTIADVMGLTGQAFQINIEKENAGEHGPEYYNWNSILPDGLHNLGIRTRFVDATDFIPPKPEKLTEAIEMVQDSLDRGIPAIVWEALSQEFGLVYGYDDKKQVFYAKDAKTEGMISYEQLGQGTSKELFVLVLGNPFATDDIEMTRNSLEMSVHHARGGDFGCPGFINGLEAYDTWIDIFKNRNVNPPGNALNVAIVKGARQFAVEFLQGLSEKWAESQSIKAQLTEVIRHYELVAGALNELGRLFPYSSGGSPNSDEQAERAIDLLTKAKDAEEKGVQSLEKIMDDLKVRASRGG